MVRKAALQAVVASQSGSTKRRRRSSKVSACRHRLVQCLQVVVGLLDGGTVGPMPYVIVCGKNLRMFAIFLLDFIFINFST